MSETFGIACHDCKIYLWIGQGPYGADLSRGRIYTAEPHARFQRDFFFGHMGHRLEFNTTEHFACECDYWGIDYDDLGTEDAPVKRRLHLGEDIIESIGPPE